MQSTPPLQQESGSKLLAQYERDLRSESRWSRLRAAEGLSSFGCQAWPLLVRALEDRDWQVSRAALASIQEIPALHTQEHLLEVLHCNYPDARQWAADQLGEIGDATALCPLMEAYHRCFLGRSARRQRVRLTVLYLAWVSLIILQCRDLVMAPVTVGGYLYLGWLVWMLVQSRSRGAEWQPFLQALLRVAARNPKPELQRMLPELKAVASDRVLHYSAARRVAAEAARQIEAWTTDLRALPLPVAEMAIVDPPLPRPASAPELNPEAVVARAGKSER